MRQVDAEFGSALKMLLMVCLAVVVLTAYGEYARMQTFKRAISQSPLVHTCDCIRRTQSTASFRPTTP